MEESTMKQIMELLNEMKPERNADKREMKAERKTDKAELMTKMDSGQERTDVNLEETEATIRSGQEDTRAAINSVRSELEETMKTRIQGLRAELDEKIMETQRQVQVIMASIHTTSGNLQGDMKEVRKNLCEAIGRTRAELGIRAKGLEDRMAEVEARVELGVGGRTRNDARRAKPPTFDGSTSWAMFQRQFETVADHNRWMPQEKATYLIAALQGQACDVLHEVSKGVTYEEAAYRSQLKTPTQEPGESLQEFATPSNIWPTAPTLHCRRTM
jgi:hypothetical protein